MKRLLLIIALFLPTLASAQFYRYQNLCQYGGTAAVVQGLASSNDLVGSYPGCTVDVLLSGTGTHATIYSDAGITPLGNPYTADVITGKFGFYAAPGCYDVVISGAGLPAPDTNSAVCFATAPTSGTVTSVTQTNNASSLISVNIANATTTPAFTFGLTQFSAHTFWGNGTGSTATPSATVIGVGDLPFTYTGNTTKLVTGGTISGTGSPLCTDASGNATTVGCSGGGGLTGSLTSGRIPVATGATTLADSNLSISGNTVTSTMGASFILSTPAVVSGTADTLELLSGASSDTSGGRGGSVLLRTADESTATRPGDIIALAGSVQASNGQQAGEVFIEAGASTGGTGSGRAGNIHILPGRAPSASAPGGIVYCDDDSGGGKPGCNIVMVANSSGGTGSAGFVAGVGIPSGTCQLPLDKPQLSGIPILYLRTDPASASTFL